MPREIVTVLLNHRDNQMGSVFWQHLDAEHGINNDTILEDWTTEPGDRKDVSFYQLLEAEDEDYIPRAIMVYLEPRGVNNIALCEFLYRPENVFLFKDGGGGGAGND